MKKLFVYLKNYKLECVLGPLFKLLEALFDLFVPLVMAKMIDEGVSGEAGSVIFKMGALLVLLAVIGLTCSITAQYFAAKAATGFSKELRSALFKHIQKLSVSQIGETGSSTLITRLTSDLNQLQAGINMALRLFLRSPFIVIGAVILSFTIDIKEGFIFAVMIPLLSIVIFSIMLITMPLYKKVQASLDKLTRRTEENIAGIRVIRAFNKEDDAVRDFKEDNNLLKKVQMKVGSIAASMNPLTYLILNAALLFVVWFGGVQVEIGGLKTGQLIALINYMTQILTELIKLADTIILTTKAVACGDRLQSILDTVPEFDIETGVDTIKTDYEHLLIFDNVSYTYPGASEEAVSDISFTLDMGETIGIIGSTGSGKSTLVHMIPRFMDTSGGSIIYKGINIKDYKISTLRGYMSIVLQRVSLLSGSIRDNLKVSASSASDEEIIYALKISESYEFVSQKKGGISFKLTENAKNLSGGQKQRLNIARGIVRKPELLILDDCFSALDYKTDAAVRKNLKSMGYPHASIIVSQRVSTILDCDRIIVMDDGHIAGEGSHEELLKTCDVYRDICESQKIISDAEEEIE